MMEDTGFSTAAVLWGLLFSSIGLGYFIYGKQRQAAVPLICGLALMIYPYFVSDTLPLVAIGTALMIVPYFISL